ncbi:MAG: polyprenyl synthetase family protein [Candidatus Eisenbacteria bacterium]|nr:polyprenyl synthetase family protein [Candidatus Eisenbacteria bacterium]
MSSSKLESFLRSFNADTELREIQAPVREELDGVDERIRGFFQSDIALLQGLSSHVLGLKGKKYRPTLLLLIARMGEAKREDAIFGAAIIELIHTATLIHDDTIDKSLVRRGLPTINALYNGYVSTILGDFIYTKAFLELLDRGIPALAPVVARTTYRMSIGEILQIEQRNDLETGEEDYYRLIDEKTSSLMAASTSMGALLAGMDEHGVERFRRFGEDLGRAYQITDDLFDYIGDQERMGKGVRGDLAEGKITLPLIHALANSTGRVHARLREFAAKRELSDPEWDELIGLLSETGAITYCRDTANQLADRALAHLDAGNAPGEKPRPTAEEAPPPTDRSLDRNSAERAALQQAVAYAVRRDH